MKNVIENKKEKTFTVQYSGGKTKTYKTKKGAESFAEKNAIKINIPNIITANTYFWHSASSASTRRYNEKGYQGQIDDFAARVMKHVPSVIVSGSFSQSRKNTYKTMWYQIVKNGEPTTTNLTGLMGECAKWGVELVK